MPYVAEHRRGGARPRRQLVPAGRRATTSPAAHIAIDQDDREEDEQPRRAAELRLPVPVAPARDDVLLAQLRPRRRRATGTAPACARSRRRRRGRSRCRRTRRAIAQPIAQSKRLCSSTYVAGRREYRDERRQPAELPPLARERERRIIDAAADQRAALFPFHAQQSTAGPMARKSCFRRLLGSGRMSYARSRERALERQNARRGGLHALPERARRAGLGEQRAIRPDPGSLAGGEHDVVAGADRAHRDLLGRAGGARPRRPRSSPSSRRPRSRAASRSRSVRIARRLRRRCGRRRAAGSARASS